MKTIHQCALCPWKVSTDPLEIPDGYSEDAHKALRCTIAEPGAFQPSNGLRLMACHHSKPGEEFPCAGWLAHQMGPGNNLALRMAAMAGRIPRFELDGEQHERFEDTLP